MGLIRGQPRQPWHSTGLASQPSTPGVAGPGPQTSLRRSMSARETYHRRDSGYIPGAPYHLPGLANSIPGKSPPILALATCLSSLLALLPGRVHEAGRGTRCAGGVFLSPFVSADPVPAEPDWSHNSRHHPVPPMTSLLQHAPSSASLPDTMYGFPSPPLSMSGNEDIPYSSGFGLSSQGMSLSMPPPAPRTPAIPPPPSIRQDEYISYYFKYVRELQYVFAGDALTNILLPVSVDCTRCISSTCPRWA